MFDKISYKKEREKSVRRMVIKGDKTAIIDFVKLMRSL